MERYGMPPLHCVAPRATVFATSDEGVRLLAGLRGVVIPAASLPTVQDKVAVARRLTPPKADRPNAFTR